MSPDTIRTDQSCRIDPRCDFITPPVATVPLELISAGKLDFIDQRAYRLPQDLIDY